MHPLGAKRMSQCFLGHALAYFWKAFCRMFHLIPLSLSCNPINTFSMLRRERVLKHPRSVQHNWKCQIVPMERQQESGGAILCESTVLPEIHHLERLRPTNALPVEMPRVEMPVCTYQQGFAVDGFQSGRSDHKIPCTSVEPGDLFFPLQQFLLQTRESRTIFKVLREVKLITGLLRAMLLVGAELLGLSYKHHSVDDQVSFASSPQDMPGGEWVPEVHPHLLIWSTVTSKMSRELQYRLSW